MKIGIDARLWSQTGVGRYIRNLVINLQKIDKKNEYVLFVRPQDYESVKSTISNSKFQITKTDIKWHSISEQINFPRVLNKEKLDLVHFPYFSVPVFYKKPFVVTIHDLIINHFPTGKASTLALPFYEIKLLGYKFVIKKSAQNSKKIIAVSGATKNEIIDHLKVDKNKISVIYNGVDSEFRTRNSELRNNENTKFKIPDTKYFLYVGNAYPHKNLERLVEAFALFAKDHTEIKLVLAGKEDYFYKRLKEKINKLNLENNIVIEEFLSDKDLVNLYKNAIALVMPSLMEGFGLPAVEAMASGCAVLASGIPSLKEICEDSAVYFNPFDAEDIRKNLELITQNLKLREELIEKGYKQAKKFSWENSAIETLKVYESSSSAGSE